MADLVDPGERILEVADRMAPRFRDRFLTTVSALREKRSLREIANLLQSGRFQDALVEIEAAALQLGNTWGEVYVFSGAQTAPILGEFLDFTVSFDQVNQFAVREMQENQLRLVREFTAEQTAATRQALERGVARGANPIEQARGFRDSIGLTQRQEATVARFRRRLEELDPVALERRLRDRRFDRTLTRAIEEQRPLTRTQINRMTERYRQRMVKFRAETIARTEALDAAHAGSQELYRQQIERGVIQADQLEQTWLTAQDEVVRGPHVPMDGQVQPFGTPFVSGAGNVLRHPGDALAPPEERIECRCAVTTRVKQRKSAGFSVLVG